MNKTPFISLWIIMAILSLCCLSINNAKADNELIDWTKEDGERRPTGVSPSTIYYNGMYYMYYTDMGNIVLATSSNGLDFTYVKEIFAGPFTNPGVIQLDDGSLRMYYNEDNGLPAPDRKVRIKSAVSTNGTDFTEEPGYRYDYNDHPEDGGQEGVPEVVKFIDPRDGISKYWLYFTYGFYPPYPNSLRAATSIDGLNFIRQDLTGFGNNCMDPDVIILSEDPLQLKMFYSTMDEKGLQVICSATSTDGVNWTIDDGTRIEPVDPDTGTGDPDVIQISSDTYRMYYFGMEADGSSNLLSAISVIIPEEETPQTTITGTVYDSSTESNVSGIIVKIYRSNGTLVSSTTSNPYTFTVDRNADYYLRVLKEGYTFPSVDVNTKTNGDHGEVFTATGSSMTIDIPIDPGYPLEITKSANKKEVVIGDIITYNISIKNRTTLAIDNIILVDEINNGFKYIDGSTYLDGIKTTDPTIGSPAKFTIGTVGANSTRNISYQVRVGTGLVPGEYSSTAVSKETVYNWQMSNTSEVKVWVVMDPLFDLCTIIGKVFLDTNGNGVQDPGEQGIPGVRIATEYGVVVETDRDGKYHIADVKPGIHLLKVDPNSLPEGASFTTDNPMVINMTSGLLAKVSFGVTQINADQTQIDADKNYFFLVGLADGTITDLKTSGNIEMAEEDDRFDEGLNIDGRIAYYLKAKVKGKYIITSSLDTDRLPEKRKQRFGNKAAHKLFTNLDPDKYYPIYGDASQVDYSATDTQDAFYLLVEWDESRIKWGSFTTDIPLYSRSLSGGIVEYKSVSKTKFGDNKTQLKGFYAVSRQIPAHDEFLGTGGSLYYLRHRDIIEGSEKIRIEIRDRISKTIIQSCDLIEEIDYEIDYDTGRIILKKPLNGVNYRYTSSIINNDILGGERVYLVVDYEYLSDSSLSNEAWGARGSQWIGDHVRIGGTYVKENREGKDPYELAGGDGTIKINEDTEINADYYHSKETPLGAGISWDGGFTFSEQGTSISDTHSGNAFSIDGKTKLNFLGTTSITLGYNRQDPHFSTTGNLTTQGTQRYFGTILSQLSENLSIGLTHTTQKFNNSSIAETISGNSDTHTTTAFLDYAKNKWDSRLEYQHQQVSNPLTDYTWFGQTRLYDNDFIAGRLGYQLTDRLHPYIRGQGTLSGETNNQGTVGLDISMFKDTALNIAETIGNRGNSTLLGITSRINEDTDVYSNLEIGNDLELGRFSKTSYGQRTALDKKGSNIYAQTDYSSWNENTMQGNVVGYEKQITDSLAIGLSYERAELDKPTQAIDRDSGSISLSYLNIDWLKLYNKLELREDKGPNLKTRQWLTSNNATWYLTKDISLLGRANWGLTEDKENDSDEAKFHELGAGLAYRPINFDRLNLLAKYSYITDLPTDIQTTFIEETQSRKHIYALEGAYDICKYLQLVSKFAYRDMEEKVGPRNWVDSDTMLYIGRLNFHVTNKWDISGEYRVLDNSDSEDKKSGWLVEIDRELFKYARIGVGYNFTDYDDDLSNSDDYDAKGWFVRLNGKY